MSFGLWLVIVFFSICGLLALWWVYCAVVLAYAEYLQHKKGKRGENEK